MAKQVFVSMPFGDDSESQDNEWTKLYDHGLLPLENGQYEDPEYPEIRLTRADRRLYGLSLKENVCKNIEQAFFVIAVLTTQPVGQSDRVRVSNPNVLWEVGYAEALGKPIVMLVDENDDLQKLPVLTNEYIIFQYNHEHVRACSPKDAPQSLQVVARNLSGPIKIAYSHARSGQGRKPWVNAIAYRKRDDVPLSDLIADAKNTVELLTTNVDYYLSAAFYQGPKLTHPFSSALRNGAQVSIVTMDPESLIAEYRARQLHRGSDVPGYRKELRDGIRLLNALFSGYRGFSMHLYNDLPLQITIRVDDTILTSVVTRGTRARRRIQTQYDVSFSPVSESFITHFRTMYDSSEDVRNFQWATAPDRKLDERLADPFGAQKMTAPPGVPRHRDDDLISSEGIAWIDERPPEAE